jgi:hypothetical protein
LIRLLILLLVVLTACKRKPEAAGDHSAAVARVFDRYLSREDLAGIVPGHVHGADSLAIAQQYIRNWVRQQVILKNAEDNLDEEKKNVEKKLREYRNSLLTYAYERELVAQHLDTVVSDQEIGEFYEKNKSNFELKDNIIRVIYLKLSKRTPKLNKAREWYRSESPKDRKLLAEYATQYALNYYLDDESWLLFDNLVKEIPIRTYDQEQFLRNNRNIEIEDSSNIYLVSIKGFKIKNSLSPLSFETANIRSMIINQRKLALIEEIENQAYDIASKNGDIEIYSIPLKQ